MVSTCANSVRPETLREIISRFGVAHLGVVDHSDPVSGTCDEEFRIGDAQNPEPVTTLMLRNLPCKLKIIDMEEELLRLGFEGTHDVIHIPSRHNGSNKGYGFVNFHTADDARRFADAFTGYVFDRFQSTKRCYVTNAAFQGREASIKAAGGEARLCCSADRVQQAGDRKTDEEPLRDDMDEWSTTATQSP
eukprot:TRINITY_DN8233_c0_g1_i3.p1 TRINITY_DN8233_c0_g1~~TRINITY_DN8233_c0_g1_i3.p1  ORF type:complete len:191 (-),score=37.72 TRINITY_DN8233_c0_g1_i3:775-1347(-)